MIWEMYAYWNSQELRGVMEGAAMLTNSGDYASLLGTAFLFGIIAVSIGVMMGAKDALAGFKWFLSAIFLYFILLVPKTDVAIVDRTGTTPATIVSNVPISLAVFGHVSSNIGDWMTTGFETVMKVISPNYALDGVSFENNGLLFGEKLIQKAENARSENISFRMNMTEFFDKCVFPEFDTGNISITNVLQEDDMWAQLSNVNPSLYVQLYNNDGTPTPTPIACDVAYNTVLPAAINNASSEVIDRLSGELYTDQSAAVANASLQAALTGSYTYYMNSSKSATDIIKQQIMTNTFFDASADASTTTAVAMAEAGASKNYGVLHEVAQSAMPKLRNVVEVVIYAVFPIIIIMVILAGDKAGMALKSYFIAFLWIQFWAPLYAIMNYMISSYNAKEIMAKVNSGQELNAWSSSAIQEQILASSDIAGMMAMAIPIIALTLAKGGEMAMTSFASNALRPLESNAGQSAREVALGNTSMGNSSMDNKSYNSLSANSFDTTPTVSNGGVSWTGQDNMKHTVNTFGNGTSTTVTDSTGAQQKGALSDFTTTLGQEQRAQRAYSQSVSAVNQASQEAAYGATMVANDVMGQTKGFDISKAASMSTQVSDKQAASEGLKAANAATESLANTDQFTRAEALKMTAYVQSQLQGGVGIGAILDSGWHTNAGVKLSGEGEQKATAILQNAFQNTTQKEASEALALQNDIATNKDLRGQLGVSDSTEQSISGATQKQSASMEKLQAALSRKEEATAQLSEAQTRTQQAQLNTGAILGHEAYGEAFAQWGRGQGFEQLNAIAVAQRNGNENEAANLIAQAKASFDEYRSTNGSLANGITSAPNAPSISDSDIKHLQAVHDNNVTSQEPVVSWNNDRTGAADIRGGVAQQNNGRGGALETHAGSTQGDYNYQSEYNSTMLKPDLQPEKNDLQNAPTGLTPDELRNANPQKEEDKKLPYASGSQLQGGSWYSGFFKKGHD